MIDGEFCRAVIHLCFCSRACSSVCGCLYNTCFVCGSSWWRNVEMISETVTNCICICNDKISVEPMVFHRHWVSDAPYDFSVALPWTWWWLLLQWTCDSCGLMWRTELRQHRSVSLRRPWSCTTDVPEPLPWPIHRLSPRSPSLDTSFSHGTCTVDCLFLNGVSSPFWHSLLPCLWKPFSW